MTRDVLEGFQKVVDVDVTNVVSCHIEPFELLNKSLNNRNILWSVEPLRVQQTCKEDQLSGYTADALAHLAFMEDFTQHVVTAAVAHPVQGLEKQVNERCLSLGVHKRLFGPVDEPPELLAGLTDRHHQHRQLVYCLC